MYTIKVRMPDGSTAEYRRTINEVAGMVSEIAAKPEGPVLLSVVLDKYEF